MEKANVKYDYLVLTALVNLTSESEKIMLSEKNILKYREKVIELCKEILNVDLTIEVNREIISKFISKYEAVLEVYNTQNDSVKYQLKKSNNLGEVATNLCRIVGREIYEVMTTNEAIDTLLPVSERIYTIDELN